MTNVYRTLARNAGYVGIVGCLLAGTPALAAGSTYVRNVTGTADGGNWVRVTTRAQFNSTLYGNRYTTLPVQVSKTTLRQGAVYALGRGVMHPGLHVAIAAAGFVWSQTDGIQKSAPLSVNDGYLIEYDINEVNGSSCEWRFTSAYGVYGSSSALLNEMLTRMSADPEVTNIVVSGPTEARPCGSKRVYYRATRLGYSGGDFSLLSYPIGTYTTVLPPYTPPEQSYEPLDESDYADLDQYIPVDIVQDLYGNNFAIPQWQDAISVMGQPASGVQSGGQIMPEVASAVGKWGDNMAAQSQGEPLPHPDQSDNWRTPQEEYYDRELDDNENSLDWDGEIPPFDDLDVEWQTETLELPAFSSGIGGGGCPGSAAISLPLGQSMTIDYQPACDLATMVKPGVIGSAGMIALLIVLRARGGS